MKRSRKIKQIIKPDGFAVVRYCDRRFVFFIEYDRGNCSIPQMRSVFGRYAAYVLDGAFQSIYNEDTFDVLVVTTAGNRRIDHLMAVAKTHAVKVRFATIEDLTACGFYGPIWLDCQNGTKARLLQLGNEDERT